MTTEKQSAIIDLVLEGFDMFHKILHNNMDNDKLIIEVLIIFMNINLISSHAFDFTDRHYQANVANRVLSENNVNGFIITYDTKKNRFDYVIRTA